MNVSAKLDYALRALLEIGASDRPVSGEYLAERQDISAKYLFTILNDLRRAGLVVSQRGPDGGYRLARRSCEITPADVVRAMDGPIGVVRSVGPEQTSYEGAAVHLSELWVAARAGLRRVLEGVTLADLLAGQFPDEVAGLLSDPDAWQPEQAPFRASVPPARPTAVH